MTDTPQQARIRAAKNALLTQMAALAADDGERLAFQVHSPRFVQASIFNLSRCDPTEFYALTHEGPGTERLSVVHCFARNKEALERFTAHVHAIDPEATLDYRGRTNALGDIIGLTRPSPDRGESASHPVLTPEQAERDFIIYRDIPANLRQEMAMRNKQRVLNKSQQMIYLVNTHLSPSSDGASLARPQCA